MPPKQPRPWTVTPHKDLEKLEDNLWTVESTLPGMPLPRRGTYIRLVDGRVVVHNAIPLSDAAQSEIERWGEPSWLAVPNGYHRLDVHAYKARYPKLRVVCPAPHRKRLAEAVEVDGDFGELPRDLEWRSLVGSTEAVLIPRSGGGERASIVFGDLYFDVPGPLPGFTGWAMKAIGSIGGPRVTPLAKTIYVKDKKAFKADYPNLLDIGGLTHVIPSHGRVGTIEDLRTAVARLGA